MADSKITDLDPDLQPLALKFVALCNTKGIDARITITWRSAGEQNAAQAAGLSNACAGESPHNVCTIDGQPCSRAFDFAVFADDGSYVKDGNDPRYTQAGEIGESLGLFWGGRWTEEKDHCEPDFDHLQLADWRTAA